MKKTIQKWKNEWKKLMIELKQFHRRKSKKEEGIFLGFQITVAEYHKFWRKIQS